MEKSGMVSLKLLSILALFIGFSFIIVEQRLESKSFDRKISCIENDIKNLSALKQEYSQKINEESERLASFDYNKLGKNISIGDIIVVPIQNASLSAGKNKTGDQNSGFTKTVNQFLSMIMNKSAVYR